MNLSFTFFSIATSINFLTSLALAFFIIIKRPHSSTGRTFSFFLLMVAFWSFFYTLSQLSTNPEQAALYLRTCMIGVIIMPATFLHFTDHFLDLKKKKFVIINYSISAFLAASVYTNLFADNFTSFMIYPAWGHANILLTMHLLHFAAVTVYTHTNLILAIKRKRGILRNQIRYVFIGVTIGYLAGVSNYLAWYRIPVLPVPNIFVSVGVAIIAYGIVRYRLMDIKVAAVRSLILLAICIPLFLFPFLLGLKYESVLKLYFSDMWWMVPMVLLGMSLPACFFIYNRLSNRAEKVVKSRQLDYLRSLGVLLENIKNIRNLETLEEFILARISNLVNVEYAGLYLLNKKTEVYELSTFHGTGNSDNNKLPKRISVGNPLLLFLHKEGKPAIKEELSYQSENSKKNALERAVFEEMDRLNISVIIPSFHGEGLIAILVLGKRKIPEPYLQEDIEAFKMLGVNTGLAIKNALYVEDLNNLHSNLIASERLAAIGRLATSAKHEISNPLNLIYGSFQQVMMDIKDKQKGYKRAVDYLKEVRIKTDAILRETSSTEKDSIGNIVGICEKAADVIKSSFKVTPPVELKKQLNNLLVHMTEGKQKIKQLKTEHEKEKVAKEEFIHIVETAEKLICKVRDFDNTVYEIIERGFKSAGRITQAVNAIYHLPKELEEEAKAVDVKELIEDSLDFTGYQSYWENLSATNVDKNIPGDLPGIKGYFNRLVSVFSNLFLNAYQAMTEADLTESKDRFIKIAASIVEDDSGFVEIRVANKGPLIPESELGKIFRQGYTTKEGNKGVGLDICKTQVEVFHNGQIFARNIQNFGPEFVIQLPIWLDE